MLAPLNFFIYAMIIFLLILLLGGTLIGYYYMKKYEYEMKKLALIRGAVMENIANNKTPKT